MDDALHREDGQLRLEDLPPGLVRTSTWNGRTNYECELCDGWYKDLDLLMVAAHIESAHEVALGTMTVQSGILGPDGQPVQKEQPAPMFISEGNERGGVLG